MNEDEHNMFFYANVCHVCKSLPWEIELKRCVGCKMIAYCSREHQKQHWRQHKDLCRVVGDIISDSQESTIFENKQENTDAESWTKRKMNAMLIVSLKLGRKLEFYEEQMFKFPRACVVCHQTQNELLIDCEHCPYGSFCTSHIKHPSHDKLCDLFRLCFDLDVSFSLFPNFMPNSVVPFHTEQAYLPRTISDFIELYVNQDQELLLEKQSYSVRASESLSMPLTLLYGLEKLQLSPNPKMVVHIIGANLIEADSLKVWEILIHWLPFLNNLQIVLIGPELTNKPKQQRIDICDCCSRKKMSLSVTMHKLLYDEYITSEFYVKPDIVIGFNLGIHSCEDIKSENNTWMLSLPALKAEMCPFIMTSYTEMEMEKDHKRLCDSLDANIKYVCQEKNPFSSLRPHRDFENEGVFFANQYVLVYENLDG